ncbi:hypothetical protein M9Y10_043928 [Tritrichomonas musculus]|uniref:Uncharacterized protein n=1 Tax=Tritrichomonas musculus TaxID=1915356 RepID=A0ABR2K229_9EUKA
MSFYFYGGDNTPKDAPITLNNKSNINAPMISPPAYLFYPEKEPILDVSLGPDYSFVLYENQSLYGFGNLKSLLGDILDQLNISETGKITFNFNNKCTFTSILTGKNFLALLTDDGCVAYAIKDQKVGYFQNKRYYISEIKGDSVLLFIDAHKNLLVYDQKTQKFFNVSIPNVIDATSYRLSGRIVITVIDSSGTAYEYINNSEGDVLDIINDIEFSQIQFPQSFNIHFVERVFAKNESVFYVADAQENNSTPSGFYVFAKGCNKFGMLGIGSQSDFVSNLKQVKSYTNQRNLRKIAIGENHTIFLTTKNYFFAVGNNESGQLLLENSDNPKYKVKLNDIWCGGNRTIFKVDETSPYLEFLDKNEWTFHFPSDTDSAINKKDKYIFELESKLKNSSQVIDSMERKIDRLTKLFETKIGKIDFEDYSEEENNENNNNNSAANNNNNNDAASNDINLIDNDYAAFAAFRNTDNSNSTDPLQDKLVKKFLNKMNDEDADVVSRLITKTHLVDYFTDINTDPSKNEELQKLISKTNVMSSLFT